jgi:hypothetical protein
MLWLYNILPSPLTPNPLSHVAGEGAFQRYFLRGFPSNSPSVKTVGLFTIVERKNLVITVRHFVNENRR